jgi:hypothetical protein
MRSAVIQPQQMTEAEAEHQGHCIHPHEHEPRWCSGRFYCETDRIWFSGASCPGSSQVRVRKAVYRRRAY